MKGIVPKGCSEQDVNTGKGVELEWNFVRKCSVRICGTFCITVAVCLGFLLSFGVFLLFFLLGNSGETELKNKLLSSCLSDFEHHMNWVETSMKVINAFYSGSSFVDYEEYATFYVEAELKLVKPLEFVEWIVVVPKDRTGTFYSDDGVGKFKLGTNKTQLLNATKVSCSHDLHLLVSYVAPSTRDFESSIGDICQKDYFEQANATIHTNKKKYHFSSSESKLRIFYPVVKSDLGESLIPKSNQNGLLSGSCDFDQVARLSWGEKYDFVDYRVFLDGSMVFTSDKSFTDSKGFIGSVVSGDFKISLYKKMSLIDPSYLVLQIVSPIIVLILALVCILTFFFLCTQCVNYFDTSHELSVANYVTKAVLNMDFDHKSIQRLLRKKSKKLGKMEKLMKSIVELIKEYRQFLPRTLLAQLDLNRLTEAGGGSKQNESDDGKRDSDDELSIHSVNSDGESSVSRTRSGYSSGSSKNSGSLKSVIGSVRDGNRNKNKGVSKIKGLTDQYFLRNAVVLTVELGGFDKLYQIEMDNDLEMKEVIEFVNLNYLTQLYDIVCVKNGGEFHSFRHSVLTFSWNTIRRKVDGALCACKAAMEICKIFSGPRVVGDGGTVELEPKIGICSGNTFFGYFGMEKWGLKQFDLLGYPSFFGDHVRKLNDDYGSSILIDERTRNQVKYVVDAVIVDYVQFGSGRAKPQKLFELLGCKTIQSDEWMYEISANLKDSPTDGSPGISSPGLGSPDDKKRRKKVRSKQRRAIGKLEDIWDQFLEFDYDQVIDEIDDYLKSLSGEKKPEKGQKDPFFRTHFGKVKKLAENGKRSEEEYVKRVVY